MNAWMSFSWSFWERKPLILLISEVKSCLGDSFDVKSCTCEDLHHFHAELSGKIEVYLTASAFLPE